MGETQPHGRDELACGDVLPRPAFLESSQASYLGFSSASRRGRCKASTMPRRVLSLSSSPSVFSRGCLRAPVTSHQIARSQRRGPGGTRKPHSPAVPPRSPGGSVPGPGGSVCVHAPWGPLTAPGASAGRAPGSHARLGARSPERVPEMRSVERPVPKAGAPPVVLPPRGPGVQDEGRAGSEDRRPGQASSPITTALRSSGPLFPRLFQQRLDQST